LDSTNEKKKGVVNIGKRPTFSPQAKEKNLEVHIFDFQKELYGDKIGLILRHKIRNEQRFSSKEELVQQIKKDEQEAKKYFLKFGK